MRAPAGQRNGANMIRAVEVAVLIVLSLASFVLAVAAVRIAVSL